MKRTVNFMDAARMTAQTSRETALRVQQYFGDAGPFSYAKVRALAGPLLCGDVPYHVLIAGIERVSFDLARKCNLDVAKLLHSCPDFRGRYFYKLPRAVYAIDRDFSLSIRPEAVVVVDGVPNLLFLQARKNPIPWAFNSAFMRRLLEEVYEDYFEEAQFWLIDTEAGADGLRELKLVDLQSVPPMHDREFVRRIASLRTAWRLHLKAPAQRKQKDRPADPNRGLFDEF